MVLETQNGIKVCLVGEEGCGKSMICKKLCFDSLLLQDYSSTIGLDTYEYDIHAGTHTFKIQLYDIGGSALKNRMLVNVLHSADAILFVYDITNVGSFQRLEAWIQTVHKTFQVMPDSTKIPFNDRLPYMALVGHKTDRFV
jgi:small GTP-binding protein